jgi:hypothetical protein
MSNKTESIKKTTEALTSSGSPLNGGCVTVPPIMPQKLVKALQSYIVIK